MINAAQFALFVAGCLSFALWSLESRIILGLAAGVGGYLKYNSLFDGSRRESENDKYVALISYFVMLAGAIGCGYVAWRAWL